MRKRAVIYLRTSTESQVDKQGPKVQEDQCRAYAARAGMDVAAVLHEAATTGKTDRRPKYAEALVMVEDGEADTVIVSSLDRLARTLTVQEGLLARAWSTGAAVHAANIGEIHQDDPDDPMRTAMRQMVGVFAQLDRSMLTKRMMDGRRKKKASGGKGEGQYRFGYTKDGADSAEQATLRRIDELIGRDGRSFDEAARVLNSEGRPTRSGKAWTRQNLAKVCSTARISRP
ncbi:recombinase family protein [Leifsonia xyli]|uniref:recombinase family protein n=1 Tax=Leifsonia xyli TaxID=1575 RepID=UPI003D668F8F